MKRVVVGLSGGVDSAVTAALLIERGYQVHGVTLKMWKLAEQQEDERTFAGTVATSLGIPLIELDLKDRFYNDIVLSFADAYTLGLTPNPCVVCNPTLKFQALLDVASDIDAHWIATGHYARVLHERGKSHLLRGRAHKKDQSYALYRLGQKHLRKLLLPLGDLFSKTEVRQLARKWELPSAERADSQDLCFMGGRDYRTLLKTIKPSSHQPGPVLDEKGERLGQHQGLAFYTIGQRSGMGIASSHRLYVLKLDTQENTITVGPRSSLDRNRCLLESVTFIAGTKPADHFSVLGRIRYHSAEVPIHVKLIDNNRAIVDFDEPQQMITPGQSLVFYQDDEVLGGGIISKDESTPQS